MPSRKPPATIAELESVIQANPRLRAIHEEVLRASASDPDPGHDLSHFLRVALWTLKLGAAENGAAASMPTFEAEHAIAAGLLHDIVNVPKSSPDRARASELSAARARELLSARGYPEEAVREIADAVRTHSFSRGEEPVSDLGRALQDADRLESLGAIGLARVFVTGGRLGSALFEPRDPFAKSRALDDRAYMVDHFFAKLLKLPSTMKTAAGRLEAERRARVLTEFLDDLGRELGA
jgi:uncharacterized protein